MGSVRFKEYPFYGMIVRDSGLGDIASGDTQMSPVEVKATMDACFVGNIQGGDGMYAISHSANADLQGLGGHVDHLARIIANFKHSHSNWRNEKLCVVDFNGQDHFTSITIVPSPTDPLKIYVVCNDSMGRPLSEGALDAIRNGFNQDGRAPEIIPASNTTQQQLDGVSCGIHSVLNSRLMAELPNEDIIRYIESARHHPQPRVAEGLRQLAMSRVREIPPAPEVSTLPILQDWHAASSELRKNGDNFVRTLGPAGLLKLIHNFGEAAVASTYLGPSPSAEYRARFFGYISEAKMLQEARCIHYEKVSPDQLTTEQSEDLHVRNMRAFESRLDSSPAFSLDFGTDKHLAERVASSPEYATRFLKEYEIRFRRVLHMNNPDLGRNATETQEIIDGIVGNEMQAVKERLNLTPKQPTAVRLPSQEEREKAIPKSYPRGKTPPTTPATTPPSSRPSSPALQPGTPPASPRVAGPATSALGKAPPPRALTAGDIH